MVEQGKTAALENASGNLISQMAYEAAMWYKACFLRAVRFAGANTNFSAKSEEPFLLPWSEHTEMPEMAERFFVIVAIDHTLTIIKDLDLALQSRNDYRLKEVKEELLDKDGFYNKIHQLRNANEHGTEYRLGIGRSQGSFCSTVSTKYGTFKTNPHWFFQIGDEVFIGGVNFMDMLKHMQASRDRIIPLLEEICWNYYGGQNNGQVQV